jgi:hypothetical protein
MDQINMMNAEKIDDLRFELCEELYTHIEKLKENADANEKRVNSSLLDAVTNMNKMTTIVTEETQTMLEQLNKKRDSPSFKIIPFGGHAFCNILCETILFNLTSTPADPNKSQIQLCLDTKDNVLSYDITKYLNNMLVMSEGTNIVTFMEQFQNVKKIIFDIGVGVVKINNTTESVLALLFNCITKTNPRVHIYFKCKNIWNDIFPKNIPGILSEFTKTTCYSSFQIEIENNFIKDPQTGNMRKVSSPLHTQIKEHCLANSIDFISNVE